MLLVCLALGAMCFPAMAEDMSCRLKPGTWSWFVNGDVTFRSDGTAVQIPPKPARRADGTLTRGKITGRWTCEQGLVTIIWSIGFTDKLVLTGGGTRLAGSNQDGVVVSGNWKKSAR